MAIRGVQLKWYDGLLLAMLASVTRIYVAINWKDYHMCKHPLHIWMMVDFAVVFIFRVLIFRVLICVDNVLAAGMGLDVELQQIEARFRGRVVVLSVLLVILYPFLWAWNIIEIKWSIIAEECFPLGQCAWFPLSFHGLIYFQFICKRKWQERRREAHALRLRAQRRGIPVSEYEVLVHMVRAPNWARQEMRRTRQREAVEDPSQELPKFLLTAVPTDCSQCALDEFHVGDEVRDLPCVHNFHVVCIDQWLRLNLKCPTCRCSVFKP